MAPIGYKTVRGTVLKSKGGTIGKGAKGAKGAMPNKGGGKGGGGWVWVPAAAPTTKGKPAKGSGKGMVKGKGKAPDKTMQKLRETDISLRAWVGGLSPKTTWKQLEKHFAEVVKPSLSHVMEKKGGTTGIVAFKTEDDVATAVASLNGSELLGATIEVDYWVKGTYEKEEGEEKQRRPRAPRAKTFKAVQTKFAKAQAPKATTKYEEKLKKMDPSLKVWIGGLSEKTTWKTLEKHFSGVAKPAVTDIIKKGKRVVGVVAYKTEEEVSAAIAELNASELDGNTLEVDVWAKPERKKKEADE
eukprot:gnl/TRDRNA2_/TRDRNA2_181407_c0_seq1.p1 gnl/TRDRNA2_/TRDRNA2_181407_c0~~gnl/TRDRNA2_/TRDRNA2_181407_c0_seq1.p1  ORF type:complete len:300 (+),score=89.15 gnl/TRDRNA2_/TRDRNA2_181407_c0_seq1:66-965(+)